MIIIGKDCEGYFAMFEINRGAFVLFGLEIRFYGIMIMLGVLAALLLAAKRERPLGLPKDTALNVTLIGVPAGVICARLYYVAFSWDYYSQYPLEIFNLREGGIAIYGAIIGGVLAGAVYARAKKLSFAALADLAAPSIALGQAIGRWGNFFNQEAYGRAIENTALHFFPLGVNIEGSGWHYATFFYESAWCALIVLLLLAAERRRLFRKRGDIFLAYVFLYALERALVEGLRTDSLYLGMFRVSQLLSLIAVWAICILILRRGAHPSRLVRITPAVAAVFLGVAVALDLFGLSVVFALITLGLAAANYTYSQR